jgi:hypothetical protein
MNPTHGKKPIDKPTSLKQMTLSLSLQKGRDRVESFEEFG